jgi:proline iminopeptidase
MKNFLNVFRSGIWVFLLTFQLQAQEKIVKTSDGVDLHVTVKGEGMPLLYVHGGPGSGAYWMEHFAGVYNQHLISSN